MALCHGSPRKWIQAGKGQSLDCPAYSALQWEVWGTATDSCPWSSSVCVEGALPQMLPPQEGRRNWDRWCPPHTPLTPNSRKREEVGTLSVELLVQRLELLCDQATVTIEGFPSTGWGPSDYIIFKSRTVKIRLRIGLARKFAFHPLSPDIALYWIPDLYSNP